MVAIALELVVLEDFPVVQESFLWVPQTDALPVEPDLASIHVVALAPQSSSVGGRSVGCHGCGGLSKAEPDLAVVPRHRRRLHVVELELSGPYCVHPGRRHKL
jgi:hypothetical protein